MKNDYIAYNNEYTNFLVSMFTTNKSVLNPFFTNKWDFNIFESILLNEGMVGIAQLDDLVFGHVNFIGDIDFMGIGCDIILTTLNGLQKTFKNWRFNNDIVVIYNNAAKVCDLNISKYSEISTEAWKSLKSSIIGTRYNDILTAANSKIANSLRNGINSIRLGEPIVVENALSLLDDFETIKHISLTDYKGSDKIQYITNLITWCKRDFINNYGMSAVGNDKIAQQSTAEIENGAYASWVEVFSRLSERQKGFAIANKRFNIDVNYNLSYVWQQEFNRIFGGEKT